MKTTRRAIDSLKRSRKESTSYLVTLVLSAALLFLFINTQHETSLDSSNTGNVANSMILGGFTILIAVICAINCYVANTYFVKAKNQELCVYLSCGMKVTALAKFLITQNMILLMIALPLGTVLGITLHPLMNLVIYSFTQTSGPLFTITLRNVFMWAVILFFEMFFLILINVGYTYTNELKHMLDENASTKLPDTRMFKTPAILYLFVGILALVILLVSPPEANFLSIGAMLGFLSIKGIITLYLPKRSEKQKQHHSRLNCEGMVIQGNINALMKTSYMYILMISGTLLIVACLANTGIAADIRVILLIAYLLSILLMGASVYFKILIEASKRKQEFAQLSLLGMKSESIKLCIRKELTRFYLYLMGFPLPFVLIICVRYIMDGQMSLMIPIYLLGSLFLYMFLLMWGSIRAFEKQCLPKHIQKEELYHE